MDSPRFSYAPRFNASTENEAATLASVYRYILDCHAKKKAGAAQNTGHDAKESVNARANTKYTG